MAIGNFSKVGRWALALLAVAVLASVAMAASNVKVVGAKPMANTVVVTLKNSGTNSAAGTVTVTVVASDGHLMQSAAVFSVGAGSQTSATVLFDSAVGSVTDCGLTTDSPTPF
jgi:hypothetical protein